MYENPWKMQKIILSGLQSFWNQTEEEIAFEGFWFISISFLYNTALQHHCMQDMSEFINSCISSLTPHAGTFIAHWTLPGPWKLEIQRVNLTQLWWYMCNSRYSLFKILLY